MPATKESKELAEQQERDRAAVAALAAWAILKILPELQNRVIKAAQAKENLAVAIAGVLASLHGPLLDSMVASYLMARRRTLLRASAFAKAQKLPKLAESIRLRADVTVDIDALAKQFSPQAIQRLAEISSFAGHELQEAIGKQPFWLVAVIQRLNSLGLSESDYHLLDMMFGDAAHDAYWDGEKGAAAESLLRHILKGYEYVSRRDNLVRPTHREEDGKFATPDDSVLLGEFDALLSEPNCRCSVVVIFGLPGRNPELI